MFFYEGYKCPVCKNEFQESDDIVSCPECGAPHHRSCWMQEGHCCYADDHGTSRQWKRPDDIASEQHAAADSDHSAHRLCVRCGKTNPEFAEFCSQCGMTLSPPEWSSRTSDDTQNKYGHPIGGSTNVRGYGEYTPFHMPVMDPYGGVSRDENIEGVSAADLVTFIGPNSAYYLPRFYRMTRSGSHVSWNWVAFLFTPYWLLYRKNYLVGGILLFLNLVQTLINTIIFGYYIKLDMSSEQSMLNSFSTLLQNGGSNAIYLSIISLLVLISFLVRIIFGMIGNSLYKHTAVNRIKRISENTGVNRLSEKMNEQEFSEYRHELSIQGGVSLILVAIASGIVWFGQMLFQAMFMYVK